MVNADSVKCEASASDGETGPRQKGNRIGRRDTFAARIIIWGAGRKRRRKKVHQQGHFA